MRRAVLIYNPTSGRQVSGRLLPAVLEPLRAAGFEIEPLPTRGPGDATRLARRAAATGIEVAFAMGGDGTLREVAAGLVGSDVALGPLPAGTANVFALACGLPRQAPAAARVLGDCTAQEIDVGMAGEEPFLMLTSCGLDAEVMAHQDERLKRVLGRGAFAWTLLHRWWSYRYPELEVGLGGRSERATLVAVCNIPYYGGRIRIAPGADFRDRRLDCVLFRGRGRAATLGFLRDLAWGRHLRRSDVEVVAAREVEIAGPPELKVQIDGDSLPLESPLTIGLARERLRVLLPAG
ncbi:MAG: diacylglycerol kinase family lipid kinase [bacterium]|nr:diacylglycerol kinase family lipid kinase [bacterium]